MVELGLKIQPSPKPCALNHCSLLGGDTLQGMWNLSSLSTDRTTPLQCKRGVFPLDHQGSPLTVVLYILHGEASEAKRW